MSDDRLAAVERFVGTLAMSLAFGLAFAWALSALGVPGSFPAQLGVALILEYVAVYVVAEGVQIGLNRVFAEPEVLDETERAVKPVDMPETDQRINGHAGS